ncbi:MAG: 50S ribosomal protein L17 [Eubacterium sp.]|nr:50S ribosomal protein L17 [Eubacterium sp.]
MPGTRKLGRTTDHRKAMLRGMVTYLFENGKVETTVTRAKEVRAMAEKMITIAKDNSLHARRQVLAYVTKEDVVKNLFDVIAPRYADVNGGYTRITKTGARRGDAAEMCIIELVETKTELEAKAAAAKKAAKKPAAKKPAAKKSAPKAEKKEAETDATAEAKE